MKHCIKVTKLCPSVISDGPVFSADTKNLFPMITADCEAQARLRLPSEVIRGGGHLIADARLFQEILFHTSALDHPALVEEDLEVLPEATGVVVADGFGVSKRYV